MRIENREGDVIRVIDGIKICNDIDTSTDNIATITNEGITSINSEGNGLIEHE